MIYFEFIKENVYKFMLYGHTSQHPQKTNTNFRIPVLVDRYDLCIVISGVIRYTMVEKNFAMNFEV